MGALSGVEWLVVLGGLGAIAWVNWYFFLAQRGTPEQDEGGSRQARGEE